MRDLLNVLILEVSVNLSVSESVAIFFFGGLWVSLIVVSAILFRCVLRVRASRHQLDIAVDPELETQKPSRHMPPQRANSMGVPTQIEEEQSA